MNQLLNIISARVPATNECVRLFHGRGKKWQEYQHLSIDFYPPTILITTYKELEIDQKKELVSILTSLEHLKFESIVLQKRYLKGETTEVLLGQLNEKNFAVENSEKYLINLTNPQNIGFFLDMAVGRKFVQGFSSNKSVLNLFSYTCSLSVAALKGGAKKVVNVDMSKASLKIGEANHDLNGIDKRRAKFLPHDIMSSFGNIAKRGPYDLVIIDPPTNQGESFRVDRDYHKIIRRLVGMTSAESTIMACLNSPHLKSDFLINAFLEYAPEFSFQEKIYSSFSDMELDPEEGLKIVLFTKKQI